MIIQQLTAKVTQTQHLEEHVHKPPYHAVNTNKYLESTIFATAIFYIVWAMMVIRKNNQQASHSRPSIGTPTKDVH